MNLFPRLKIALFVTVLAFFAHLPAEIIEAPNFTYLLEYVTKNPVKDTLVLLDIDDTLLIPIQSLGTDVWFGHRFSFHQKSGMSAIDAVEKTLAEWEAVRHLTKVKTVEENTAHIVNELQNQGVEIIGLTTQGLTLAVRTVQQLKGLHINLNKTAPHSQDYYFMNDPQDSPIGALLHNGLVATDSKEHRGVLFRDGILFTAGSNKATAVIHLLNHFDKKYKRIIFINDKITHLQDAEGGAEKLNIPFVGLRYAYSDERVKAFRPEIAEIQYKYSTFENILSDEEAEAILKK